MKKTNIKFFIIALLSLLLLNACTKCSSSDLEKNDTSVENQSFTDQVESAEEIDSSSGNIVESNDRTDEPAKSEPELPPNDYETTDQSSYPPSSSDDAWDPPSEDSSTYGEDYEDYDADENYE